MIKTVSYTATLNIPNLLGMGKKTHLGLINKRYATKGNI